MPKKPKKKLKTIGKLKIKADRRVQDRERAENPGKRCEIPGCPNLYQVIHHFIEKSSSNYLRYEPKNYVYVCNIHHSKFHCFPDPAMNILVHKLRGDEWFKWIQSHRHLLKRDNRKEIENI